jgi:hypothetical protein
VTRRASITKVGLIALFASFAIAASGQPATHSSGFPIGSQFAVDAIDGKPSGNRPRTFAMQVAPQRQSVCYRFWRLSRVVRPDRNAGPRRDQGRERRYDAR